MIVGRREKNKITKTRKESKASRSKKRLKKVQPTVDKREMFLFFPLPKIFLLSIQR